MIVMPANSTGWFWHSLARETGRIGHLYSPRAQTGPFPWFPYALDNGAFSCWTPKSNYFDDEKWESVAKLRIQPEVICVGGSTEWKWENVAVWAARYPRVHLLRCNSPAKLYELESMGIESCDGTGWLRGDKKQTSGLEEWARSRAQPHTSPLWPYTCKAPRVKEQESFA